jgi:hypothetical protein
MIQLENQIIQVAQNVMSTPECKQYIVQDVDVGFRFGSGWM